MALGTVVAPGTVVVAPGSVVLLGKVVVAPGTVVVVAGTVVVVGAAVVVVVTGGPVVVIEQVAMSPSLRVTELSVNDVAPMHIHTLGTKPAVSALPLALSW